MNQEVLQINEFLKNAKNYRENKAKEYLKVTLSLLGLFIIMFSLLRENYSTDFFLFLSAHSVPLLLSFLLKIIFFCIKAFIFIEALGYFMHRFFEHLGFMTRRSGFIRQNQQFHWTHHMIMYPLGTNYVKGEKYNAVPRPGFPWYWILPAIAVISLLFIFHGINWESILLFAIMVVHGKIIELTHYRFHLEKHPWSNSKYFQWISDIHILHHFDQTKNYTIVNPLMDMLFGTYLSPKGRIEEIKKTLISNGLNTSDLINWNYLLIEATPAEYAVFISASKKFPGILNKARQLLNFLKEEILKTPENNILQEFYAKTQEYLQTVSG